MWVYNLEKIIRRPGTGGWLTPANFLGFFPLFRRLPMGRLQSGEIHILPGIRGYLISAGFLKFGRCPKGGYNIENIIRRLGAGGGLIPAIFS